MDLRHREAFMTSGAFCIRYFYTNLSKKQISICVAKLKQKAINKLTSFTQNSHKYHIFLSCVIARTKLHRPFAGTF